MQFGIRLELKKLIIQNSCVISIFNIILLNTKIKSIKSSHTRAELFYDFINRQD